MFRLHFWIETAANYVVHTLDIDKNESIATINLKLG